nr:reverse transcriptase domain-containing protein [Tanacetum cinerariifolium]
METRDTKKSVVEPAHPACDPHNVEMIERLQQRIQELQLQQVYPDDFIDWLSTVERDHVKKRRQIEGKLKVETWEKMKELIKAKFVLENFRQEAILDYHNLSQRNMTVEEVINEFDKAPYYPGFHDDHHDNPLLTKKTKSEPIMWDIEDEIEEYPFVNKHPSFQEEPIMLGEKESSEQENAIKDYELKKVRRKNEGGSANAILDSIIEDEHIHGKANDECIPFKFKVDDSDDDSLSQATNDPDVEGVFQEIRFLIEEAIDSYRTPTLTAESEGKYDYNDDTKTSVFKLYQRGITRMFTLKSKRA